MIKKENQKSKFKNKFNNNIQRESTSTAVSSDESECCFRYGFGERMKPCCLTVLENCDGWKSNNFDKNHDSVILGGSGIIKSSSESKLGCPTTAAEAHRIKTELLSNNSN